MVEKIPGCPIFKEDEPTPVRPKGEDIPLEKPKHPVKEILDWYKDAPVKPYVSVRDLNQGEGPSKPAVEVGIKFSF